MSKKIHIDEMTLSIERDGKTHSAKVYLYEGLEALRRAAVEYDFSRFGDENQNYENLGGITHSFNSLTDQDDGTVTSGRRVCIVRMLATVGAGVSSHELFHVACHMYRTFHSDAKANPPEINLGDGLTDLNAEEELAHIQTELVFSFANKMVSKQRW